MGRAAADRDELVELSGGEVLAEVLVALHGTSVTEFAHLSQHEDLSAAGRPSLKGPHGVAHGSRVRVVSVQDDVQRADLLQLHPERRELEVSDQGAHIPE